MTSTRSTLDLNSLPRREGFYPYSKRAGQCISVRRLPAFNTNKTILTAFVTLCAFMVILIHLETSRILIPGRAMTQRQLHILTSGFSNDISSREAIQQFHEHVRQGHVSVCHIGFSHCGVASYILEALSSHPDILINHRGRNSTHYRTIGEQWRKTLTSKFKVTVDSSILFSHNVTKLRQLLAFDKDIRVLVTVCNPINRLVSVLLDLHDSLNKRTSFTQRQQNSSAKTSPVQQQKNQSERVPSQNMSRTDIHKANSSHNLKDQSQRVSLPNKSRTANGTISDHNTMNRTSQKDSIIHHRTIRSANLELDDYHKTAHILLKKYIFKKQNVKDDSKEYNLFLLSRMVNFLSFIRHIFSFMKPNQIFIVEENSFLSNKAKRLSELYRFLGVQSKPQQHEESQRLHNNNDTIDRNKMDIDTMTEGYRSSEIADWLTDNDPTLMEQLTKFYSMWDVKLKIYSHQFNTSIYHR